MKFGRMPCLAFVTKMVTLVVRRQPAAPRVLIRRRGPGNCPGFAGEYATFASSGCAASSASAPALVIPTTSGTETSLGLQSASVSGPSPEKYATSRALRQYPLSSCHFPSRSTTHCDTPPR